VSKHGTEEKKMETNQQQLEEKKMVLSMCTCKKCPTWVECGEGGGFCFVTIGKSACISDEKGCIYGGCPVHEKMGLKQIYYCTKGSEQTQLGQ